MDSTGTFQRSPSRGVGAVNLVCNRGKYVNGSYMVLSSKFFLGGRRDFPLQVAVEGTVVAQHYLGTCHLDFTATLPRKKLGDMI